MRTYEVAVLLHPDLEIDLEKPLQKVEKIIRDCGGTITGQDTWGKRKLAYPVTGHNFAVYVFYQIDIEPSQVAELEHGLKITDEVIRHLVVHLTEEDMAAAADKKEAAKQDRAAPAAAKDAKSSSTKKTKTASASDKSEPVDAPTGKE